MNEITTFEDFNLNNSLRNALSDMELTIPTAIQSKSFAPIMSGKDVVGIAQTGTGKTYAYLLPLMRLWKYTKSPFPQTIIVVPTRELVVQVEEALKTLTEYLSVEIVSAYGGTNMRWQKVNIHAGADVVIGTPGRLIDLMLDGVLKTKKVKHLVLDEVDEMLNLGFRTQLYTLLDFMPQKRQNLMFSATMIPEVEVIINEFTNHYDRIEAAPSGAPLENIEQGLYRIENFNSKANLLELLFSKDESMSKVLVFAGTKKLADALYARMSPIYPEKCGVIHSSKSQNNRFDAVNKFQAGEYRFLIATDIIARGLDITMMTHVINFDLPDNSEKYIHRIGRTGRAEQKGIALSFVSTDEEENLGNIEALMNKKVQPITLPEGLELSDELIDLEKEIVFVPFNNHKMREFVPSGEAFHDKKKKNTKVNHVVTHAALMKEKYNKPKTRSRRKNKK